MIVSLIAAMAAAAAPAPRPLTAKEKAAIVRYVSEKLKDPASAQWQWYPYRGDNTYCGRVNAKNSYGGYEGFVPYYMIIPAKEGFEKPLIAMLAKGGLSGAESEVVLNSCRENGYSVEAAP